MIKLIKAIFSLLDSSERRFSIGLIMLIIATGIIELMGTGLLFPYIKVLSDSNLVHKNHLLSSIYNGMNFHTINAFYIFLGLAIFGFIFAKACMSVLNSFYQAKYTSRICNRLSEECIKNYMGIDYAKFSSLNTSTLSKSLLVDIIYTIIVITAILSIITDAFVSLCLIALMVLVAPTIILAVSLALFIVLLLAVKMTGRRILKIGVENERYTNNLYKASSVSLQGIKDIKIHGVEEFFKNEFLKWRRKSSENSVSFSVFSNLPAVVMNTMVFGILLAMLLFLVITYGNIISVLPVIGIIAVSVQRMLPAANRISLSIGHIRQYTPNFYIVKKALSIIARYAKVPKDVVNKETGQIHFDRKLTVKNVSYHYNDTARAVLTEISFSVSKFQSVGIIGPSGAGKSTLVDIMLGLLQPQSGEIFCVDINVTDFCLDAMRSIIGYVPQQTYLFDGDFIENIAFGVPRDQVDLDAVHRAIKVAQLTDHIDSLAEGLNTIIGEQGVMLSGGQRQRVGIARALYRNPEVIIMDEATSAMDSFLEEEFNAALKQLMHKKTLIIVAHRFSSIMLCDKIIVLDNGKIVASGSHAELRETSALYRKLYQGKVEVEEAVLNT